MTVKLIDNFPKKRKLLGKNIEVVIQSYSNIYFRRGSWKTLILDRNLI